MGHHKQLFIELQEGGYEKHRGDDKETYYVKEFPRGRVYVEQDGEIWTFRFTDPFGKTDKYLTLDEAEAAMS